MIEYNAQVTVIAAGPSGLSAAVQAAENGAEVVVLEKAAAVGGAANMGMGPLGIGTRYQKQSMNDISVEKAFNMMMEYNHYNIDGRLIRRYFGQSAETIEWLEDMGVEFEGAFRYFPKAEATWHIVKTDQGIGPRAASFMNKALFARAQELGVRFVLETPAKKIIMEDGRVRGVIGVNRLGEEVRINCSAAVICTGGAGSDTKLIKEETGLVHGENLFSFTIPGVTGDGLRMAWEAGADRLPVRVELTSQPEGLEEYTLGMINVFSQPNLLVNRLGKRFMNEEQAQNTTYLANAILHQKDKMAYSIVDTSILKHYIRNGVDVVSLVRPNPDVSDFYDGVKIASQKESDNFAVADTIEELAEKIGIKPEALRKTVDSYNEFCDSVDQEFFKDRKYLRPVFKAPFYAVKFRAGGYGTVGGIRINENCEVCNPDFEPIPGLYAAGADACNIYDDSYMFLLPGNSMGFAVNTGRIAGMSAAAFVSEKE